MNQSELALSYQALIQKKFPNVYVVSDLGGPQDTTVLDAFLIENDARAQFENFLFDEVYPAAEKLNIPWALFILHTEAETAKFYPKINYELSIRRLSSTLAIFTASPTVKSALWQLDEAFKRLGCVLSKAQTAAPVLSGLNPNVHIALANLEKNLYLMGTVGVAHNEESNCLQSAEVQVKSVKYSLRFTVPKKDQAVESMVA